MKEKIKERINEYEGAITKLVNDHTSLMGALSELKNLLAIAEDVAEVVAPKVEPFFDAAGKVVEIIEDALNGDDDNADADAELCDKCPAQEEKSADVIAQETPV
jgi:hypothetical protein